MQVYVSIEWGFFFASELYVFSQDLDYGLMNWSEKGPLTSAQTAKFVESMHVTRQRSTDRHHCLIYTLLLELQESVSWIHLFVMGFLIHEYTLSSDYNGLCRFKVTRGKLTQIYHSIKISCVKRI